MKKVIFAVLLASALLVPIIALATAAPQERPFNATFAGIHTNKSDLSFTGAPNELGVLALVTGKSTMGDFTGHMVVGTLITERACTVEGVGEGVAVEMLGEVWVLTLNEQGDQLFLKLKPGETGESCFVGGVGTLGTVPFDVAGGTGRFEGASGSIVKTFKGIPLVYPGVSSAKGSIFSFTGSFEGTIKFAK